jgi:hypothetical protein
MNNFNLENTTKPNGNHNPSEEKVFITTKIKKHKNWTKEEDKLLLEVALKYKEKSWTKVAECFKDKNPAQCRARFKRIRPGIVKGPWTKEEDMRILELVDKHGRNWAMISKTMPSRNGKQIRDRFINYLDPLINKLKFSPEEDARITELYLTHGSKWSVIAKEFPGRTGDMIKNRFYSCLKRRIHVYEVQGNKKLRKNYYQNKKLSQLKHELNESSKENEKDQLSDIGLFGKNPYVPSAQFSQNFLGSPTFDDDQNLHYLSFMLNQMKQTPTSSHATMPGEKNVVQLMQLCHSVNK